MDIMYYIGLDVAYGLNYGVGILVAVSVKAGSAPASTFRSDLKKMLKE